MQIRCCSSQMLLLIARDNSSLLPLLRTVELLAWDIADIKHQIIHCDRPDTSAWYPSQTQVPWSHQQCQCQKLYQLHPVLKGDPKIKLASLNMSIIFDGCMNVLMQINIFCKKYIFPQVCLNKFVVTRKYLVLKLFSKKWSIFIRLKQCNGAHQVVLIQSRNK